MWGWHFRTYPPIPHPHQQIVPVTQLTRGRMRTPAFEGLAAPWGWDTHALLCINPAPPVAQSGNSPCHPHVMCWNKQRLWPFRSSPPPHAHAHITCMWVCENKVLRGCRDLQELCKTAATNQNTWKVDMKSRLAHTLRWRQYIYI